MNTKTIHILIAACTLIAAGIASFPYRLSCGNTSWLPWWMQPDCKYLERPYEYDYSAWNITIRHGISICFFRFDCNNRDSDGRIMMSGAFVMVNGAEPSVF